MLQEAESLLNDIFAEHLKPQKYDLTVAEWADENRFLSSKSSPRAGRWKTSRTPYLKEPMEMMSVGSTASRIVLMFASQLGKTEALNNLIGYTADYAPAPILMVQPTLDMVKKASKQRLAPMIAESPSLRAKFATGKSRDASNTLFEKEFTGGMLLLATSGSAASLASMPIKVVLLDETDRYEETEEGSASELAETRTANFSDRKIVLTSTPTIKGESEIEAEYEASDQRKYYVPCPYCKHKQLLWFKNLRFDKSNPSVVTYECEECHTHIEEHKKTWMLGNGEWIAKFPDRPVRGYWLNSLYSPVGFSSWSYIVDRFLRAKDRPERLKVFTNTILGETWEVRGEAPDYEQIYRRRENYVSGTVPKDAFVLTAGADVQENRIEIKIEGWGRDMHRYAVDYITIPGDPDQPEVWRQMDALLEREFPHELGCTLKIRKLAIDTGGSNTQSVYAWVRDQDPEIVMGVKGKHEMPMIIGRPTQVDIVQNGEKIYRATQIWMIGVSHIKSELFGYLRKEAPLEKDEPYPFGWCHFPEWDLDWFKGLCSEKRVMEKGRSKWVKTYERNEPLDTTVYARAASAALGVDHWTERDWDALKQHLLDSIKLKQQRPSVSEDNGGYINRDRESYI